MSKLDATPPWQARERAEAAATEGPFDEKDAPDDGIARVDLGALFVPVSPGIDVRLELNEQRQVVAVTLVMPEGTMQLGVYAAPRSEGIWDEVRAEIAASMNAQKGQPKERTDGPFGIELTGQLPAEGGRTAVRFIGVDGPRWFLRAMLVGTLATDAVAGEKAEQLLRDVIVSRGTEPLPVREAVPLRLPKDVELPEELAGPGGGSGAV